MKYKLINLIILIILIVVSFILIVFRLGKDNKISNIKKLYYSLSGGMSYNSDTKYELICGEECVLNIKIPYQLEKRGIKISRDTVLEIVDELNKNNVSSWDNFDRNDYGVLDGPSFSFSVTYNDNEKINARGYMKYPKNYHKVISYLDSVFKPLYTKSQLGYLFDLEYYKDLDVLNISKIIIEKSTISGKNKTEVKNKNDIIKIYNEWKGVIIGNSTNKMCDDNTIIYRFIMNNKKEYIIEKECDFLVIDGMRYNYKVEKLEKS